MERKERSCSKSLCVDRGSSPSSPSRVISPSSPGPSSPLVVATPSPTKTPSSSSSSVSSTNEDNLCPSSGPSSSPSSSILRKRPHTYSSPAPENALPKLSQNPSPSGEGKKEEGQAPEKEFDSDEDSNDDSNVDPFGSEGEGEGSNDDSALSDPFKSSTEGEEEKKGGSDGEDSNDDSAISDPFGSDGSNSDSAISDPFGGSDNDNPDSDIIMSDCEEEEEEEDPIPDYMASRLSYDHRPDSASEQERIKALGGVIVNGRVGGQLAVTRAIGDAQLFPFVSPEPYISETDLRDDDEFLVIACDGLFDVFPDDVVVTIARGEKDPEKASERLSRQAFGAGSTDNISVVVVRLLK